MSAVGSKAQPPIMVTTEVNGQQLSMELDTGATASVISMETKAKLFPNSLLNSTSALLTTYTGEQLPVVGQLQVEESYQNQCAKLPLYVAKGHGPSLLGRDWLRQIKLSGLMNTFDASLHLKPDSRLKFQKARPVPFALKQVPLR